MSNPYFGVRYAATDLARDNLATFGMDLNDAINAVRNCNIQTPARKAHQRWCYGPALNGTVIRVLTQETAPLYEVLIIAVRH